MCTVRNYAAEELDDIIARAEAARHAWAAETARVRATVLRRWFDLIIQHREELALICTLEAGKPLYEARGELDYAASFVVVERTQP